MNVISPFIYGFIIAYLANPVMKLLEHKVLRFKPESKWGKKLRRPLSVTLTFIFLFTVVTIFVWLIVPQVADSFMDLETQIESDVAKHTSFKGKDNKKETWEAFGNVVITNFKKGERLETDTLYWNREAGIIHTHTLVKMFSPQGFMQGYGMESDEMARNAHILKPFDSYGVISRDSSAVAYTDTVNFIGPRAR
jgi:hypothetical protein